MFVDLLRDVLGLLIDVLDLLDVLVHSLFDVINLLDVLPVVALLSEVDPSYELDLVLGHLATQCFPCLRDEVDCQSVSDWSTVGRLMPCGMNTRGSGR